LVLRLGVSGQRGCFGPREPISGSGFLALEIAVPIRVESILRELVVEIERKESLPLPPDALELPPEVIGRCRSLNSASIEGTALFPDFREQDLGVAEDPSNSVPHRPLEGFGAPRPGSAAVAFPRRQPITPAALVAGPVRAPGITRKPLPAATADEESLQQVEPTSPTAGEDELVAFQLVARALKRGARDDGGSRDRDLAKVRAAGVNLVRQSAANGCLSPPRCARRAHATSVQAVDDLPEGCAITISAWSGTTASPP